MPRLARASSAGIAGLLMSFAFTATAQPWPAPIQSIQEQGVTIVERFDAPGGMKGFAARAGSRPLALYLTPDGEHVIIGTMLDANGNNITEPNLAAASQPTDLQQSGPMLDNANWVADGPDSADRVVYAFTDPNCRYCHIFYERSRPWIEAGAVQIRHIPVGVIERSSIAKAATILAADDPSAALARHEARFESGGLEPLADIPTSTRRQVARHNQLMAELGIRGTPGIIYENDQGELAMKQGAPQGDELETILGPRPE